jgi:hypothetical protein
LHSDSPIEYYEVRWFPKTELDTLNNMTLSTKDLKAHIGDLIENTEYGFQVRCKTLNGYGTYSNIVYAQTLQNVSLGKVHNFVKIYGKLYNIYFFYYHSSRRLKFNTKNSCFCCIVYCFDGGWNYCVCAVL